MEEPSASAASTMRKALEIIRTLKADFLVHKQTSTTIYYADQLERLLTDALTKTPAASSTTKLEPMPAVSPAILQIIGTDLEP